MCNSVHHKGRWYNTPAELAELVGGADRLVWQETNPFIRWPAGKDWHVMDECLCPINLEATFRRAGLTWTLGTDPMEWFITSGTSN